MNPPLSVSLYESLAKIVGMKPREILNVSLTGHTFLKEVLSIGEIPFKTVQLVMLSHRATDMDVTVQPGDRLALFPSEYPFFVGWNHFRNRSV